MRKSSTPVTNYELLGGASPPAASHCRVRPSLLLPALTLSLCATYVLFSPSGAGAGPHCSFAALTLSASPSHVVDGGDLVVSWTFASATGACTASQDDFLTLSCGPVQDDNDYFQRRNVSASTTTSHSVRFSDLYAMRCTYVVQYFAAAQVGFSQPQPVATLEVRTRDPPNAPKHGHLAFSERDDEMVVMFTSASSQTPRVRFGVHAEQLALEASGASTTYAATDMCVQYSSPGTQELRRLCKHSTFERVTERLGTLDKFFMTLGATSQRRRRASFCSATRASSTRSC